MNENHYKLKTKLLYDIYLEIQRRSTPIEDYISALDSENKFYFTKNELRTLITNFDINFEIKDFEELYDYLRGNTFTITTNRLILELVNFLEIDLNEVKKFH